MDLKHLDYTLVSPQCRQKESNYATFVIYLNNNQTFSSFCDSPLCSHKVVFFGCFQS